MPRLVSGKQKQRIRLMYKQDLKPKEIENELWEEFGKEAASMPTIMRELRKLRLEEERKFDWHLDTEGEEPVKAIPWTIGTEGFTDDDKVLISKTISEALVHNETIPRRTSEAQAKWIAIFRKAYPSIPAIIIWHAAKDAELVDYVLYKLKIEDDYRHIERALQFQPWKGDREESLYWKTCRKEGIKKENTWWWKAHAELFRRAEAERIAKKA